MADLTNPSQLIPRNLLYPQAELCGVMLDVADEVYGEFEPVHLFADGFRQQGLVVRAGEIVGYPLSASSVQNVKRFFVTFRSWKFSDSTDLRSIPRQGFLSNPR